MDSRIWINDLREIMRPLTAKEQVAAERKALHDILHKVAPVPVGKRPTVLFTIGAPGAGKSTVAPQGLSHLKLNPDEFCVIDVDLLVKYHPRYNDLWSVADAHGRPTPVSFVGAFHALGDDLEHFGVNIVNAVLPARYNAIIHAHDFRIITFARELGYRVVLQYVTAPLKTAQQRARDRALRTGRFLSKTLRAQDEIIAAFWSEYQHEAAWYALWADSFLLTDNSGDAPVFTVFDPHASWPGGADAIQAAIKELHAPWLPTPGLLRHERHPSSSGSRSCMYCTSARRRIKKTPSGRA